MANTNVTTVQPSVLPGLEGLVSPLYQGAFDTYNMPYQPYQGQLVSPLNQYQNQALQGYAGNASNPNYAAQYGQASNLISGASAPSAAYDTALAGLTTPVNYQQVSAQPVTAGTVNPSMIATGQWGSNQLGQYLSPYMDSVAASTLDQLNHQNGIDQAALKAQLAAKGSFGDRSTLAQSEQARNQDAVKAQTLANLYNTGYGQALSAFNSDQSRGLQAAQSNQNAGLQGGIANLNANLSASLNNAANALTAGRSNQSAGLTASQLGMQGLGQAGQLDLANRGLGVNAGTALGNLTSGQNATTLSQLAGLLGAGTIGQQTSQSQNTADYNQFLRQIGYPQQQTSNLASILYGAPKGSSTSTPAPSDLQQILGGGTALAGLLGGTGAFGGNGWLSSLFGGSGGYTSSPLVDSGTDLLGGLSEASDPIFGALSSAFKRGGRIRYADGGDVDDGDDTEPDEDSDDDYEDDPLSAFAAASDAEDDTGGGGDDQIVGGMGGDQIALSPRTSGFTPADIQAALAAMQPKPVSAEQSLFAGGPNNALTTLGLGILASKSPHLGEALGQGGLAALTKLDAQTKLAQAAELARQKQAGAQAQLIGKAVAEDNKALNTAQTEQMKESGRGDRALLTTASRQQAAETAAKARQAAAQISAGARIQAAELAAKAGQYVSLGNGVVMNRKTGETMVVDEARGSRVPSAVGKLISERDALPEDDPRRKVYDDAITKATSATNGVDLTLPDGTKLSVGGAGKGAGPQSGLQPGNQKKVEEELLEQTGQLMQVNRIADKFNPTYQTVAEKARNSWTALKDKAGFKPSAAEAKSLDDFTNYRSEAAQFFADRLKAMSGSAVTEDEAKRQTGYLPDPGTGILDGDSPTQLQAKLKRMQEFFGKTTARLNYVRKNGLSIENVPLDKMDSIMNERGNAIAATLKAQGLDDDAVKTATKAQLAREFGLIGK